MLVDLILLFLVILVIYVIYVIYQYIRIYETFVESEQIEENRCKNEYTSYKQLIYTDILKRAKRALDRLDIPFFLSSGTCLGYFRENKFIDHDYDVDLGIFANTYTPEIVKQIELEGLELYRILGTPKTGMELSFRLNGTKLGKWAKLDIFLHYPEKVNKNDYYSWYTYEAPKYINKIKYRVSKFSLEEVDFLGININVPNPTYRYIIEHYGKDWSIPKKTGQDYWYASSPKSIVK